MIKDRHWQGAEMHLGLSVPRTEIHMEELVPAFSHPQFWDWFSGFGDYRKTQHHWSWMFIFLLITSPCSTRTGLRCSANVLMVQEQLSRPEILDNNIHLQSSFTVIKFSTCFWEWFTVHWFWYLKCVPWYKYSSERSHWSQYNLKFCLGTQWVQCAQGTW